MIYLFKEFKFNSTNLVLTKDSEAVAIGYTEAKLLVFLLERAGDVLSKEEILTHVWQNKIVSEQPVFQNISHLRSLFGSDSIKTFSKRGYQWQLEVKTLSPEARTTAKQPESNPGWSTTQNLNTSFRRPVFKYYALLASISLLVMAIFMLQDKSPTENIVPVVKLAYVPFFSAKNSMKITFDDTELLDFTELTHLNAEHFLNSLELEYRSLEKIHPFVLTGQFRDHAHQVHLDFLLKGPFSEWRGEISGASKEELVERLQQHLKHLVIFDTLGKPLAPEIKQANLAITHQLNPTDLIILGQLVNAYIEINELDKASVMAEKLANLALTQDSAQQLGNAFLFQATLLAIKKRSELSAQKLRAAFEQFEKIGDLKRQADVWIKQSWLDHQQGDYTALKASLLKSAELAYQANDKSRELHALSYLSVMANKHKQDVDKYLYLQQAESKMKAYQLPLHHFSKVPFHYAIFAKSLADKEPHLKKVLEYSVLTPDYWVAQSSRLQLVKYYLEQNRLAEAEDLVKSAASDNASNSYLKSLLAKAKQQTVEFISYAQKTFEQSQLAGDQSLSLDVALLLCQEPNAQIHYTFYAQYIHTNSTEYWRQSNEMALLALNL